MADQSKVQVGATEKGMGGTKVGWRGNGKLEWGGESQSRAK